MATKLQIKNLRISFRTNSGKVQAVRGINLDLEEGETLAIVGESGSGKSVTSKAVLGILAGNSIVEGGEVLYDGKDLMKIPEDEFHKIRGDKIAMIFQDPLSSLNPIVKIGRQLTEAMILKNKVNRKNARREFNTLLKQLKEDMLSAVQGTNYDTECISEMIKTFDDFNILAIKLENKYNSAYSRSEELLSDVEHFLFMAEKKQKVDVKKSLSGFIKLMKDIKDDFYTFNYDAKIADISGRLVAQKAVYEPALDENGKPCSYMLPEDMVQTLTELCELLKEMHTLPKPNFFRIGYYIYKNPTEELDRSDIEALNEMAVKYLDENYMLNFIEYEKMAVRYSANKSNEAKKQVLTELAVAKAFFSKEGELNEKDTYELVKALCETVVKSIDRLEYVKDSIAYTFASSINYAREKYFTYVKLNPKEEARYERQMKKYNAMIEKGKKVEWKVVPKNVCDLNELKQSIISVIERLETKYSSDIESFYKRDFESVSVGLINYLKDRASQVVYKVTARMAKDKAIKLMEEVGISEPRTRYNQYPFEFSGGMRQRIVIAIALAADPDILICDEPTTALDVTIQSQILELINKLKAERNLSVIFITHDLGVVANMADRVAVMYAGKIVEMGTAEDVFYNPKHPYTWALLSSMPDLDTNEKLDAIPGTPPNMIYPPVGDAFAARNKYALKIDFEQEPPMFKVSETHSAATWLLHPDAPKVDLPKVIRDRIERMNAGGNENV